MVDTSSQSWPTNAVVDRLVTVTEIRQDGTWTSQHFFDGHEISHHELVTIEDSVHDEQWTRLDHPTVFLQL